MPIRKKKCASCKVIFQPDRPFQKACSVPCAVHIIEDNKKKKNRQQYLADIERLKSRSDWLKEAQIAFNAYIRYRDKDLPCISCQRHHTGQYHAGHYRSVGACPELRFEELNNNKQCSACNNYLSGNIVEYRKNLVLKIGADKVEWLEGKHEPKKYSIEEIKAIKLKYKQLIKWK